jgi:hypothetical protein
MYEALIARLRAHARDLREAADALERIQKMQPVAWIDTEFDDLYTLEDVGESRWPTLAPLYRFPIGKDK